MLNNIKEHLFAPHLTFAQFFQLQRYKQYKIHESVVTIPTNLNLVQKCTTTYAIWWFINYYAFKKEIEI
jgi:hypothetical protein